MLAVERAAERDRRRALAALERGRGPEARTSAERALTLHRSADSLIVRALVALAERDFPTALRLRREIRRAGGGRPGGASPHSFARTVP